MKIILLALLIALHSHAAPIAEDKKLILVFTEMTYCPWCHKMTRETIDEPEAKNEIEKRYIIAKITRESGDIPLFLHPRYYPTSYILSADGNKIVDELPGYMEKSRFLAYIKDLYDLETSTE